MILGTVELGLDYGINNSSGKPTSKQAFELLDAAWSNGIRELDTAAAYGDSESIIGNYQKETGHFFHVDTKLPVSIAPNQYEQSLEMACERLHLRSINLLYLHSFEQCYDNAILGFLKEKKEEKVINDIGISIYEPSEMNYILEELPFVDTIQLPFSVFDYQRWMDDELLKKAKKAGKKVYARSIFLQGLIFKSPTDLFVEEISAQRYISELSRISVENGFSVAEMAYNFVAQTPYIDDLIIGCQSTGDVMMNVSLMKSGKEINSGTRKELERLTENISHNIIDPRKWRSA